MTKITTILFDFDGTIMNTDHLVIESMKHTFSLYGISLPLDRIIATFGGVLENEITTLFQEYAIPTDPLIAVQQYRDYHDTIFTDYITLFDGMEKTIKDLKTSGFSLAVITSRLRSSTIRGLDKFDLTKYFDYILTHSDTDLEKPDPALVYKTLDHLHKTKNESLVVGDTKFDILLGKNSGVKTALAGWGRRDIEKPLDITPDLILYSPLDLKRAVEESC